MNIVQVKKPVIRDGNPIVESFGEKIVVEMKTSEQLMNWIIFGDPNRKDHFITTNDYDSF